MRRVTLGVQCAAAVALTLLVHHRVYTIPFLYSEVPGIQRNPAVTSLAGFAERMLTPKGLLQRPVSVLSYALNHAIHGDAVFGFHLANVAVHCANVVLVMLLARRLLLPPLAAGLLFALHPLATACVGQVFGRNYSLATTFGVTGLVLFLRWRGAGPLGAGRTAVLALLLILTVLTKQSLVVFSLLYLWWEIGPGRASVPAASGALGRRPWRAVAAGIACAALGLALIALYALPLSRTAVISPPTFFLSQLGHARTLARFYLLPYQTALVHDLELYPSAAHPDVWLGAAAVAALAGAAWRWRSHPAGWLAGAVLLCLAPTNSVFPKNEVIREWRLYPSLVFVALLGAAAVAHAARRLGPRPRGRLLRGALYGGLAAYLATFAHANVLQNERYQSGLGAWRQVLERYPRSADAMNNVGMHHYRAGDLAAARDHFARAAATAPEVFVYWENLAWALYALGDVEQAIEHSQHAKDLYGRLGSRAMALRFKDAARVAPPRSSEAPAGSAGDP
jgi:hypothetical protein